MERECEYLLHLLGAFLRKEKPRVDNDVDWNRLVRLAQIHNIVGILGYMTMNDPICPDAAMNGALRKACLGTMMGFANRSLLAEQFSRTLSEAQIEHIPLKGAVVREYYPVQELRTFGDIDLVIHPEDREKCHRLMIQLGFQTQTDWEPVFSYEKNGERYELHTELLETDVTDRRTLRDYFQTPWAHACPGEGYCRRLTPEYHFLFLLAHIAKHVTSSGAGIRMYLDVGAFILWFREALDWGALSRELERLSLDRFAGTVLALVERYLGIPSPLPSMPVEDAVLKHFLEFTMEGGIFGKESRNSGAVSLKEAMRSRQDASRGITLFRRLFPAAKQIESRYTYLQDRPWLLPLAWVHRLVITGGGWRDHAREARDILSADRAYVMQLNRLYRQIGL